MEKEAPATITKADMVDYLCDECLLGRVEAREFVELFFEVIKDVLVGGEEVKLSGLGHFYLRTKKKRPGRNPKTQESVPISDRRVVTFRPGPKFKQRMGLPALGNNGA